MFWCTKLSEKILVENLVSSKVQNESEIDEARILSCIKNDIFSKFYLIGMCCIYIYKYI